MTCEVAVMNKSAIALAADSAATLEMEPVHKIYMMNKLFALSEEHPVGIMIYGKPNILGVPWETVIEMYRKKLGKDRFGKLVDYLDDLINFIERAKNVFPDKVRTSFFRESLLIYYTQINKEILKEVESYIKKKKITTAKTKEIVGSVIAKHLHLLEKQDKLQNVSASWVSKILTKHASTIMRVKTEVFEKLPISPTANSSLKKISGYLFSRNVFRKEDFSGFVMAGFGDDEIFPNVKSLEIEGIVNGKAKYRAGKEGNTSPGNDACIIPFAQEDMVRVFMEGTHPKYHAFIFKGPEYLLKGVTKILPDIPEIKGLGKAKLKSIISKFEEFKKGMLDKYRERLTQYMNEEHIQPIMNAVSYLPEQELAEMAESLVRLVAFKRRMSVKEVETVGGPIDVAVISKANGFVWIKHKSYFKQELNPPLSGS